MPFSIFNKSSPETFLVFDIGNASVGGAVVGRKRQAEGVSLEIVAEERANIPLGEHVRFERLLKNMLGAVGKVSESLAKASPLSRASIYVILASPWYASQTKMAAIKKDKPFVLTRELTEEVISSEVADFKQDLDKRNKPGFKENLEVIEGEIIHIRMNDYELAEPFGKTAREAKLALYLSVSQREVVKRLTEELVRHFPRGMVVFHSFPLAYFSAVRDIFPQKNDFLLLDVSGEITDVSLVRRGILRETISFPLGRNFLLRRVASGLRRTMPEAESLLALLQSGTLRAVDKEKLVKIVELAKTEWLKGFQSILVDLSSELYVPGEVYLAADNDVSELFSSWISEEQFSQYALTHEKFNILPLSFGRVLTISQVAKEKQDQFINIGALFAEKLIESRG